MREGTRLLLDLCPDCASPLLDRKGEIWCPKCNRKVLTVRERSAVAEIALPALLANLTETIHNLLWKIGKRIRYESIRRASNNFLRLFTYFFRV